MSTRVKFFIPWDWLERGHAHGLAIHGLLADTPPGPAIHGLLADTPPGLAIHGLLASHNSGNS